MHNYNLFAGRAELWRDNPQVAKRIGWNADLRMQASAWSECDSNSRIRPCEFDGLSKANQTSFGTVSLLIRFWI